jgi:hypothetical protein
MGHASGWSELTGFKEQCSEIKIILQSAAYRLEKDDRLKQDHPSICCLLIGEQVPCNKKNRPANELLTG